MSKTQTLLVVSGPSGSGKSSLCASLCKELDFVELSVSTTTRPKRPDEVHGMDYFFVTKEEFEAGIKNEEFLEWAVVHGNYYGTNKNRVDDIAKRNKIALFDIDVQGYEAIRSNCLARVVSVFINTKDLSTLKQRLNARATDNKQDIERRLRNAFLEVSKIIEYDYLVVNEDYDKSLLALTSIARSINYKKDTILFKSLIEQWKNN